MPKYAVFLIIFAFSASPVFASYEGPFQVRNQFPIFLPVSQPFIESASTADSLSLGLSHSSIYVIEENANWTAGMDLELTELNLRLRKQIPDLFEIGIDLPFLRATGGFMDRPLAWYHRAFGLRDYGRADRPENTFLYEIRKDGRLVVKAENDRAGVGDLRLTMKKNLLQRDLRVSLLGVLELPTGNARIGYGNGSIDAGLALLMDIEATDSVRTYLNLGAIVPGDLKAHQTVGLRPFYYGGAAMEFLFRADFSLIGQLMVQTSPYPETGIASVDTTAFIVVLGGRYAIQRGSIEFSLTEDPNTSGAPDFTVNLTYRMPL